MGDKISNSQNRIKERMNELNMKQTDILEKAKLYEKSCGTKLSKTLLSEYVRGNAEPGSKRLMLLAKVLNVSEPWLMGLDVPKERANLSGLSGAQSEEDMRIIDKWQLLSPSQKKLIEGLMDECLKN